MTDDPYEPVTEMDLLAYVDGHLDPARRQVVAAHLAMHPEDAERVRRDAVINDGLRQLFEECYTQVPPARLSRLLRRPPRGRGIRRFALGLAAAALTITAAGTGFWVGSGGGNAPAYPVVEQLAAGTITPAAVSIDGEAVVGEAVGWLADRLHDSAVVPDLTGTGFELMRQTLVGSAQRPAVQLTYVDRHGRRLDLFLQARWELLPSAYSYQERRGRGLLHWTSGPLVFALTGDVTPGQLRMLGQVIDRAAEERRLAPRPAPPAPGEPAAAETERTEAATPGIVPVSGGNAR